MERRKDLTQVYAGMELSKKLRCLELAVSDGINRVLGTKDVYDNVRVNPKLKNDTIYGSSNQIITEDQIPTIIATINEDDIPKLNYDQKTLLTLGWEFIWGAKTPEEIVKHKEYITAKSYKGEELTDSEKKLLIVSYLDTDSF